MKVYCYCNGISEGMLELRLCMYVCMYVHTYVHSSENAPEGAPCVCVYCLRFKDYAARWLEQA